MLPSLNNTVGSKEYKYQCNEATVCMPREKREGMPTSMTRPAIETPLDNGQWQIWLWWRIKFPGEHWHGTTFPSKSQINTAKAAGLTFSLFVTDIPTRQHKSTAAPIVFPVLGRVLMMLFMGHAFKQECLRFRKTGWPGYAGPLLQGFPFSFRRNMEFLPLKAQRVLIQVSIFNLQVQYMQKIIVFL